MSKGDIRTSAVRARTAEFLIALHDHLCAGLKNTGVKQEAAEGIADHVIDQVRATFGGEPLYIPKGIGMDAVLKHHEIYRQFNGHNHHELARLHNVSVQWVYYIVRTIGRQMRRRDQPDLFTGILPDDTDA